jgi:hypothetical protein
LRTARVEATSPSIMADQINNKLRAVALALIT